MRFTKLKLPGVLRVDLDRIEDERGFLSRMFCQEEMAANGVGLSVAQCNNTLTRLAGTIRGMHFQRPPKAEIKMVRCIRGAIFDVVVDLRSGSATYGHWCSVELNEQERSMLIVPKGFAHGFQTLRPDTELIYFHSESYCKPYEGGLDPLDAAVAIPWPLPLLSISERDRQHPGLSELKAIEL